MSTNATAAETAQKSAKSKKLLVIGAVVVLLLMVAGAAAWFMASRQSLDDDGEERVASHPVAAVVPTFLPMENMVVNLADPGGERFAQLGITLELADAKTADLVKQYMPSIRSNILLLVSQRTSDELLLREGKEKLAADILKEVSRPLGFKTSSQDVVKGDDGADADVQEGGKAAQRRKQAENPVRHVHFSGFIIQ